MYPALESLSEDPELAWFCVRSRTRHEHIASASLRRLQGMEVVNPRIRFRRPTVRGPISVIESMFPGYLFAKFSLRQSLDVVKFSWGVADVVHFGCFWPMVSDETIQDLQDALGPEEIRTLEPTLKLGEQVEIAGGAFRGFNGIVTRIMPARDRVTLLLEFLGRQTTVELPRDGIIQQGLRHERVGG